MQTVKKGKSFTRRYYEDLFERFEEEIKWIDNEKKLEAEKEKLIDSLDTGVKKGILTQNQFQEYLTRIKEIKLSDKTHKVHEEQGVISSNNSVVANRTKLIHSKEEERNTLSMADLKAQIKERQKEVENNNYANTLRDELQKALTEEKERDVKEERERK